MFGLNVWVVCVIRVRKNWFVGTTDTVPENDMQQQQRFIFYFFIFILRKLQTSKLFVWAEGRGRHGQKHLYSLWPQVGVTQSSTCQRSMGNLVPGGRDLVFNWDLKLIHLFNFFWNFKFSFCINLQWKRLKSNNILEYF